MRPERLSEIPTMEEMPENTKNTLTLNDAAINDIIHDCISLQDDAQSRRVDKPSGDGMGDTSVGLQLPPTCNLLDDENVVCTLRTRQPHRQVTINNEECSESDHSSEVSGHASHSDESESQHSDRNPVSITNVNNRQP